MLGCLSWALSICSARFVWLDGLQSPFFQYDECPLFSSWVLCPARILFLLSLQRLLLHGPRFCNLPLRCSWAFCSPLHLPFISRTRRSSSPARFSLMHEAHSASCWMALQFPVGLPLGSHGILRILSWLIADLIANQLHLLRKILLEVCRRLRDRPTCHLHCTLRRSPGLRLAA